MKKPRFPGITRRSFLQGSAGLAGALPLLASAGAGAEDSNSEGRPGADGQGAEGRLPDLRPARWIWYPSGRCLPSTFVLFRKELELNAEPRRARGWILADSRYLLSVNGKRIQWGPAPSDPRWMEVDPLDLTDALRQGRNVLGAQVLFYGHGDGTWPAGKPGFLFWLEVEIEGAPPRKVVSDASWSAHMARSWRPGQYKRWYLRALQEDFDARLYPHGWNAPGFAPGGDWLPAMPLGCPADKPPICSSYPDYLMDSGADPAGCELRPRSIPLLRELMVSAKGLVEHAWIDWKRPPEEYFESLTPGAFEANPGPAAAQEKPGVWKVLLDGRRAAALTFELEEQVAVPPGCEAELVVPREEKLELERSSESGSSPLARYRLPAGKKTRLFLEHA